MVGSFDLAENYPTKDQTLEAGDVVALDADNPVFVSRADAEDSSAVVGIVSTLPGIILGGYNEDTYVNEIKVALALSGRVPVKVTEENGPIKVGDRLTVSTTTPGYAMKMTESGQSIGIALENFDGGSKCGAYRCGKVVVLVNVGENVGKIVMDQQKQIDSLQKENVAIKREFETRLAALEAKIK